jgi:PAS domain S-box-containing protein
MKFPLHILHLEDNPRDAALVQSTLEAEGIACATICVQNRADFVVALEHGGIDLVLSDFSLPAFDGLSAMETVRAQWPAIPVILVSGTLGEERAIEALKCGATDYVLKERLGRLAPAVRRAMQEVESRAKNRQTEAALQEMEQRLHIVFNESPLGIALVGVDGRPILTNAALQKMLGYTGEELSRMRFIDFTHPDDCVADTELYQQLIHGARKSYQIQKRYLRKDGKLVWARLTVSVAREAQSQAVLAIAMVEDITERRDLEAQFIEAQKMEAIGHLAGGVAHDFNNILAVIMGYSDLLTSELGPDSPLRKDVEEIRHASDRAAGLTRQLLVFSRKQMVQPVVLDLNDAVKDLEKMLRRLVDENIKITVVAGKHIGRVKADPGYVGQLLMNLVINARDAMPNGGQITIATDNVTLEGNCARTPAAAIAGDYVVLSVRDTGTGMTDEVKSHLFEAFFTTKPSGQGTGLGLATCQTIVQQSGGHIDVCSQLGQGTTFKIYFPRIEQPLEAASKPGRPGPVPRGTETLLVVEDEPSVRHLARGFLETLGYEVLSAANGQDGLHVAREHQGSPIRLVITDVVMPLMGGKVMAEWLKTTYPDIKILFTSGYTDDAIAQYGVLDTGVEFLPKPYTPATLARKVRELLDAPAKS